MRFVVHLVRIIIPIIIGLSLSGVSIAQQNHLIKKYGIADGLSQAVVNSITQDKKGMMWFATDDGVNRFNGYEFQTFRFDCSEKELLHDNFVQRIFNDKDGNLWISSRQGMYRFDLSTEKLFPFLDSTNHNRNDVSFIAAASTGNLWTAWYWDGFGLFNKSTSTYTPYNSRTLPELTSKATITMHEDSYGLLWVGTQDRGLNVFDVKNENVIRRRNDLSDANVLPSLYVKCLQEDHFGNIWIGTTQGLVVYVRRENRFYIVSAMAGLDQKPVFSLSEDSEKTMWIGTRGRGLYAISLKNMETLRIEKLVATDIQVLDNYDISHHTFLSIFEDKDKNIWLGTHGDGIFMIGHEEKKFLTIQTKIANKSAERLLPYNGLCNDADGNIWASSDGAGIFKMDRGGQVLKQYKPDGKNALQTDVFFSAYRDEESNLWFGSYSKGLYLYDKRADDFINYPHSNVDSLVPLANQVRMIFEDSKGNLWVGATRGGVCLVDRAKKNFKQNRAHPIFKTVDARAMVEDNTGVLWFGCYGNGLAYYKPDSNEWSELFAGTGPGNPLNSNVIYALALDDNNRLWIGTGGGGLSVYNLITKELKRYTERNGLLNNTVYALAIDEGGNVWASTIRGLSKLSPETNEFTNFTSIDGLQEGQFNPGAVVQNRGEHYIAFAGAKGINLFYPDRIDHQTQPPRVMLSKLRLFNHPVKVGDVLEDEFTLSKVVDEVEWIELKHDQSVMTFEFAGLDYLYPEKIEYKYKLDGFDREWNRSSNVRSATYKYLPPGTYQFKVKAAFQDSPWPTEYASMKVTVLPPFWRTPLAYFVYSLVFAGLLHGVYRIRKRQHFLRNRLLVEKNQRKQERQLVQDKLSFFTEVSHEFRTPLTLMIGPLEEILSSEGTATPLGKKLKMVYKNSFKLLNLINKLLDYRKIENGNLLLNVNESDIVAFVNEIFIGFRELADRRKIEFEFYTQEPEIITWFDQEKLEMVLTNVLSNSFKYIGNGTAISVSVKRSDDNKVVIEIKDNGIGISKEDLKHIFDWFYQGNSNHPLSSGIGLALAKKLILLHKGQIYAASIPGKGSSFIIKLPIGKEHFNSSEIASEVSNKNILVEPSASLIADTSSQHELAHKKGIKRILIVEDDEEVRGFIKQYFEPRYKILESTHGRQGLEAALEYNPDIVISDVLMPQMDGMELCRELKTNIKTSHIPVILLTAKTALTHHREGLEFGADHYITKPFSPEMLNLTVNNLLQSRDNLRRYYQNTMISTTLERSEPTSPDEKLLKRIHEIVKANLDDPDFNLDSICHELNMSRSFMYKKIKVLTGLSPLDLVRSIKLGEAASLLKTQKYKVFEVVYMVGFSDIKYFRECFVKQFGYPPSTLLKS